MNPFNHDKIGLKKDFCGRETELAKLKQVVLSKNNLVVYGERRYGKSALISNAFLQFPDTVLPVDVDIYNAVDEYGVALAIYDAVIKAIPFSLEEKIKKLPKLFTRLSISMMPSRSGESVVFKPQLEGRTFEDIINDTFDVVTAVCKREGYTHAVISIDEFQEVGKMERVRIDAVLRTISQRNDNVCFIFSGSKKNMLRKILNDKSAPWYGMTTPLVVKEIETKTFHQYCAAKLNAKIDLEVFSYLMSKVKGQTQLVLKLCGLLYADMLDIVTTDDVDRVFNSVVDDYDDEYRHYYMRLPSRQRNAIMAIGLSGGKGLFASSLLKELRITKQALLKSLEALEASEEVVKEGDGAYRCYNLMLQLWVENRLIQQQQ